MGSVRLGELVESGCSVHLVLAVEEAASSSEVSNGAMGETNLGRLRGGASMVQRTHLNY
jgi:hypothetical protein